MREEKLAETLTHNPRGGGGRRGGRAYLVDATAVMFVSVPTLGQRWRVGRMGVGGEGGSIRVGARHKARGEIIMWISNACCIGNMEK